MRIQFNLNPMQFKSSLIAVATLSLALSLSACSFLTKEAAIEISDLGVVVMAPEGYTMEKVTEDGFDIYRVSSNGEPVADIEDYEGYDFDMQKLATIEGTKEVITSWHSSYKTLEEVEGEYGAAVSYETEDSYGVLAGMKYEDKQVVCQAAKSDSPTITIGDVMDICKSMIPSEKYSAL